MRFRVLHVAVVVAVVVLTIPLVSDFWPVEAQYEETYCRVDRRVENRLRKLQGEVNVECGSVDPDECFTVGGVTICHSPPFGNWGVASPWGNTENRDQFLGWWPDDGHHQWNSCTSLYDDSNDGPGRQKSDRTEMMEHLTKWHWAGRHNANTCRKVLPEVKTYDDVELDLYELDLDVNDADGSDLVGTLDYGTINVRITCNGSWDCSGESGWRSATTTNGTGVSSDLQVRIWSAFSY